MRNVPCYKFIVIAFLGQGQKHSKRWRVVAT